ncbi:hypothetical protein B0A52_07075 [Exophiala mesophila]|uniref:Folic acid synthesis protein FOL1 n=1 Tax=Exophiala mesophila TaxID=212818 RepID=A0A438MY70_EXOME|nr:hypothetical protein B0A52_07075 [Exophiala mesophila]
MQQLSFSEGGLHRAVISFGSNLTKESRITNIESALKHIKDSGLQITKTSHLYETKPMYYDDQEAFLNGVCEVETTLPPLDLLDLLQGIESRLGRVRSIRNGPRTIDLDVLLYDNDHIKHDRLHVPHPLMLEREFVLRPLCDILPDLILPPSFCPNTSTRSIRQHFESLTPKDPSMSSVTVVGIGSAHGHGGLVRSQDPNRRTLVMAILNATPDSFSNTKLSNFESSPSARRQHLDQLITAGLDLLDIGGQSTRPGATFISAEEELARVMPWITAMRAQSCHTAIPISVDTFHSLVARESIRAGADIINDVSAGALDDRMLATVAELGKTIILMHMRGNPQTMTTLTDYPEGVVSGVRQELAQRVRDALAAGIYPWRIILDPGIGFAKDEGQNLELLRHLHDLRSPPLDGIDDLSNFAWLVGTSRKGFIGKITDISEPDQRQYGTAATVMASIAGGADMVRVHDIYPMVQVVRMSDAIYRRRDSSYNTRPASADDPRAESDTSSFVPGDQQIDGAKDSKVK